MKLTDTHTHLHFGQYQSDLEDVVSRAQEAGVRKILTLGTDLPSSMTSLNIALRHDFIYAAAGIHPTDIFNTRTEDVQRIRELAAAEEKIVSIGEIGLDLYWKEVPLERQIPVFEKMIELAAELDLPVVIHNREAHPEMRQFFLDRGFDRLRGVMHSFSGTAEDACFYLDRGLFVSFTGVITFKNFKDMEVVRSIPFDRILLETDSPFLTPVPHRGKRNEPAYVRFIAEKLSEVYETTPEDIAEKTFLNANRLFGWGTG